MQFTHYILTALVTASSVVVAAPSTSASVGLGLRGLCSKPFCTSQCPDGTDYNCCVTYIRDPCWDHQKCEELDCLCKCKDSATTYLCNAQYFRDPCAPLPNETAEA